MKGGGWSGRVTKYDKWFTVYTRMSISNQIFMQCINQFNDGDCDQIMLETFEDIKRVIRSSKSKDRKYYGQKKKGK